MRDPRPARHPIAVLLTAVIVTALLIAGVVLASRSAAALQAAEQPTRGIHVTDVTTTSHSADRWARIAIDAAWEADTPMAGDTFDLTVGEHLAWPQSLSTQWPLTTPEGGEVGYCRWPDGPTSTCTLDERAEAYDHLTGGYVRASAQRTEVTTEADGPLTITVAGVAHVVGDEDGDGICDTLCQTIVPQATPTPVTGLAHTGLATVLLWAAIALTAAGAITLMARLNSTDHD